MTPPTLRAIKCSERMPTREDANGWECVLWIDASDGFMVVEPFNHRPDEIPTTHWLPLNRSAIATDAEEQT
jgi:hypothetical protein